MPNPLSTRVKVRTAPRIKLSPAVVTVILGVIALAAMAFFMFYGLKGPLDYVLPRRAIRMAAMVLVAGAVGISTLLFQTVTANRILTPSIMGFDALYLLIQTSLVFAVGAVTWTGTPVGLKFAIEVALMVTFSFFLYRWLFNGAVNSLHLVLIVGIILGTLFRGISSLLQRLMDPNEFVILQDLFFASFNQVNPTLLLLSAIVVVAGAVVAWRWRSKLDVMALGREIAINLGVDHRRSVMAVLLLCAVLVSVSTALVGPITFFGLLIVSLAYQVCRGFSHAWLLPITILLGIIALVAGQLVLEHVFGFATALSVAIEFAGGLLFLFLLLKGSLK
ncbi:iron chelate uptake ABC transporter family permease subunit [Jonesiaceae bacterium BS-20]|uniref:Iron chelate uptake ABC transporter family permease subunit n=1 Tax=Jonesiaceae bacterium BS-20 TaxID=3120821 RepID=A0AAU7DU94_9MICO